MLKQLKAMASLDSPEDREILRKALHSPRTLVRAAAASALHDHAAAGNVPRDFTPEALHLLDIYWDKREYCAMTLRTLTNLGDDEALQGFDARLASASRDLVNTQNWLTRSKAIDTIDDVHSLIVPERRSYEVTCLALLHVLASNQQARNLYSKSKDSTPRQRAGAFAILRQIYPSLLRDLNFENDEDINLLLSQSRAAPVLGDAAAQLTGYAIGAFSGDTAAKAGGAIGRRIRRQVKEIRGIDESARQAEPSPNSEHIPRGKIEGLSNPAKMPRDELLTLLENRVNIAAEELLSPDVSTLRERWRNLP